MNSQIYEIRRHRLRELINSRFEGSQVAFALKIDREPNYVSRCLSGIKRIGEKFANLICDKCDLPKGWLDGDEGAMLASSENSRLLRTLRQLSPEKQAIVFAVIKTMINSMESNESIAQQLLKKAPSPKTQEAQFVPATPKNFV